MSGPDGIVLVDKPAGVTSHDVVDVVRRALGTRKVGHAGTLDPMATGLLVIGVGRATRLLRYLGDLEKTYQGTARLGEETDTLDAEGTVVRTAPVDVNRGAVEAAATSLVGASMQRPPAYSAVKVGGRKLYEAARSGETLEAEARPIVVRVFEVTSYAAPTFDFRVAVSSGTYVRVLVADVGSALGCGAHLVRLVRTEVGPFSLRDAVPPDRVSRPLPLERAIAHLPAIRINAEEARVAANGSILGPAGIDGPYGVFGPDRRLIGVYRDEVGKARPEVILPPA
ncbi:MAG: tRNA pseudouridine(55) synthase TruB [Actinomycetota bacterium]